MALVWLICSAIALTLNLWRLGLAHRNARWAAREGDDSLKSIAGGDRRNATLLVLVSAFFAVIAARRLDVPISDPWARTVMYTLGTLVVLLMAWDATRSLQEQHRMYMMWLPIAGFFTFRKVTAATAFATAVTIGTPVVVNTIPHAQPAPAQRDEVRPDGQEKDVGTVARDRMELSHASKPERRDRRERHDEAPAPKGEGSVGTPEVEVSVVDPPDLPSVGLDLDDEVPGVEDEGDLGDVLEPIVDVLTPEDSDGPPIP